jgi:anti-sigma factor RsiW
MTCEEVLANLGPFVDNELAPEEAARMSEHLQGCVDCARAHRRLLEASSQLKGALIRYEAPDVLKARIRAGLAAATIEDVVPSRQPLLLSPSARWLRTVAAAGVVAIASSAMTVLALHQRASSTAVENEVLASHIRSLMPGHLTDVASNDQHNVKPWFAGRVNVSPDVPRLDSLGYLLVGGRVDYIDGHNVATVVYSRRQHVINVFSWPVSGVRDLAPTPSTINGYNIIRSRVNGIETWIVSDLNLAELKEFARMVAPRH